MPDLQGFMPQPGPGTIYGGNWSEPYSGVMDTLASVMRARDQRNFAQSPFGGSFQRRFSGNFSPIQNELDAPSTKTGQMPGPGEQARLLSALQSAAESGGQFVPQMVSSHGTSGTYAGPAIESSGPLQGQGYYDELIAAAQGGADLPMIRGNGGTPIDQQKQAAYKANRAQDMKGRRALVQQKAQAKSDQMAVDMGNLSDSEATLRGLQRLQQSGGMGGVDPIQLSMLGPDAYVRLQGIAQQGVQDQWKQGAVNDPRIVWANAGAQAGTGMDLPTFIRQWSSQQSSADSPSLNDPTLNSLYENSGGDWNRFKLSGGAAGLGEGTLLQYYKMKTGEDPNAPSFWDRLWGGMNSTPTYQHENGQPYPIPYG